MPGSGGFTSLTGLLSEAKEDAEVTQATDNVS